MSSITDNTGNRFIVFRVKDPGQIPLVQIRIYVYTVCQDLSLRNSYMKGTGSATF